MGDIIRMGWFVKAYTQCRASGCRQRHLLRECGDCFLICGVGFVGTRCARLVGPGFNQGFALGTKLFPNTKH